MAIQPDFAGHVNEHNDNVDNNVAGEAAGDGFHQTINEYAQDHNRQGGEQIKDFATWDQYFTMLRVLEKNPNDVPQPPNNPPQGIVSDGIQQQLQQQQLQQQQSNNNLNR